MKVNDILNIKNLLNSLNSLKDNSKPEWGVMSSAQMLKHCNRHAKLFCNEYNSNIFYKIMAMTYGKYHLFNIKYLLKYDIKKFKGKSKIPDFLITSSLKDIEFEKEKDILIDRLKYLSKINSGIMFNPAYGFVKWSTNKKVIFSHVCYHLDQFGVLNK
ncbi:MAG: hypothetical protein P8I02_06350 [Flavobacteriales bacterium]|nr:hypothetical protein [Flavobacteriales bacterium]